MAPTRSSFVMPVKWAVCSQAVRAGKVHVAAAFVKLVLVTILQDTYLCVWFHDDAQRSTARCARAARGAIGLQSSMYACI